MLDKNKFLDLQKDKSYEELIELKDELVKEIKDYENLEKKSKEELIRYQFHLIYLEELCKLIVEKSHIN